MILNYDHAGAGPAIVLLHARPADRTQWRELVALLAAAGYHAIAPDLAGYGSSRAPTDRPAAPWADVRDTLDDLGVDRALLVGNSLGAQTALQLAATWPDRVVGMCLMGFRRHDQPASPRLTQAWEREAAALSKGDLAAAGDAGVAAWLSPAAGPAVREVLTNALRNNLSRRDDPGELAPDPLADDECWTAMTMPTRILHGADDMPDFAEGAQRLRDELRAPDITIVADAAHLLPLERPAPVATAIFNLANDIRTTSGQSSW
ncbi:alpha/beta fold hydrolase [Nocardia alni]|uniref:alpha/beta fold hydrolase n=1 Tax=Nocardia alni TaxID=2815723 RepID=UPI001C221AB5|nr:alpha/beta hydrolase [Nocardia alni]